MNILLEFLGMIHNMDGNSSLGPDGFGRCFFQSYWDIVGKYVINPSTQIFYQGWILLTLNSINVVFIPKHNRIHSIEKFRSLALDNFRFKIST